LQHLFIAHLQENCATGVRGWDIC